jgi:hypothetical protein
MQPFDRSDKCGMTAVRLELRDSGCVNVETLHSHSLFLWEDRLRRKSDDNTIGLFPQNGPIEILRDFISVTNN